jgi:hypothetical protein
MVSGNFWPDGTKPSERLELIMAGRVNPVDEQPAVQSIMMLQIYQMACLILEMPKEERKPFVNSLPLTLQPYVEDEVRRIFDVRRAS